MHLIASNASAGKLTTQYAAVAHLTASTLPFAAWLAAKLALKTSAVKVSGFPPPSTKLQEVDTGCAVVWLQHAGSSLQSPGCKVGIWREGEAGRT